MIGSFLECDVAVVKFKKTLAKRKGTSLTASPSCRSYLLTHTKLPALARVYMLTGNVEDRLAYLYLSASRVVFRLLRCGAPVCRVCDVCLDTVSRKSGGEWKRIAFAIQSLAIVSRVHWSRFVTVFLFLSTIVEIPFPLGSAASLHNLCICPVICIGISCRLSQRISWDVVTSSYP